MQAILIVLSCIACFCAGLTLGSYFERQRLQKPWKNWNAMEIEKMEQKQP